MRAKRPPQPTPAEVLNMRNALRLLHDVEIVGDVPLPYWPHVAGAIDEARRRGSSCSACEKKRPLRCTALLPGADPKRRAFFHMCLDCGMDPRVVQATITKVASLYPTMPREGSL